MPIRRLEAGRARPSACRGVECEFILSELGTTPHVGKAKNGTEGPIGKSTRQYVRSKCRNLAEMKVD